MPVVVEFEPVAVQPVAELLVVEAAERPEFEVVESLAVVLAAAVLDYFVLHQD